MNAAVGWRLAGERHNPWHDADLEDKLNLAGCIDSAPDNAVVAAVCSLADSNKIGHVEVDL